MLKTNRRRDDKLSPPLPQILSLDVPNRESQRVARNRRRLRRPNQPFPQQAAPIRLGDIRGEINGAVHDTSDFLDLKSFKPRGLSESANASRCHGAGERVEIVPLVESCHVLR